jgi:superfamily II DNA or RNA helicase
MSFKSLDIKPSYESGVGDIVQDFYEPVLTEAVLYDRISGFFSSTSLAVAARGMCNFIKNGGIMRLITSPILSSNDVEMIEQLIEKKGEVSCKELGLDLAALEDALISDHVKAFGWLLSSGKIDIRLAILLGDDNKPITKEKILSAGLFHQKIGILTDTEGNHISFSGSINETASAWTKNDEEFKVFKEWEESSSYYYEDRERFNIIWSGKKRNVIIVDLPHAVKNELIEYSKDFDVDKISAKQYIERKRNQSSPFELDNISLFYYQKEALDNWKKSGFSMLFEMATGTGKTRTAIAGFNYVRHKHTKTITIVACPQNALAKQWKENEVASFNLNFDKEIIIDGTVPKWKSLLKDVCLENGAGFADHCIIYTTHDTASSTSFTSILSDNVSPNTILTFVGDEVHWLGAKSLRMALLPIYKYRIGLSATPSRWFDDAGTRLLENYFGNNHYEFTMKDALAEINPITGKHFLVDYMYLISRVCLNEVEGQRYAELTDKISKLYRMKDNDSEAAEAYEHLLQKRADIIKNAENKYLILSNILDKLIDEGQLENLIIFVSPQQKTTVLEMLERKAVVHHQLTQEEGNVPRKEYSGLTERQYIIKLFKEKKYQVLVAIKCLDEGIDIPSACRGILMSSSTNPREYVQRIGRIIRQDKDKKLAYLYDICVESSGSLSEDLQDIDTKIRANERKRLQEIAENAINSVDALQIILKMN